MIFFSLDTVVAGRNLIVYIIGSFQEKTLTWSKPYIRKLVFCNFGTHFYENVRILCKLDENAGKCVHFQWKTLPSRVTFIFEYWEFDIRETLKL